MEPIKKDGKMREQIQIEHEVRRKYQKKWGEILNDQKTRFYKANYSDEQLMNVPSRDLAPYEYTGHGDSYFVSKDMYDSLVAVCRCGRPKTDGHLLKCLRSVKKTEYTTVAGFGKINKLPQTSTGMYGWPHNRYAQLEMLTRYVSPTYDIPGGRINARPYSSIFIG